MGVMRFGGKYGSTLAAIALGGLGSMGLSCGSSDPAPFARAPILLVVLDALDAGHLRHLGYERATSPNLDALAAEGVSFERALSPAPYTLAGIPSLLTGRLPDTHQLTRKTRPLRASEVTLAEMLQGAGYKTFGAVSNPNGSSMFGCEQGFEVYHEPFRASADVSREEFQLPDSADYPDLLREWLAATPEGTPGFYYMHLLEPHSPYDPPEPYRSTFLDPEYRGPMERGATQVLVDSENGLIELSAADRAATIDLYDANVLYADEIFRRLVDALKEAGVYDEAIVIVTSDHGEAFWQHGHWGHNDFLHEEMLRVPLIVKLPGQGAPRGRVVEGLASTIDVLPSLAAWVGAPSPSELVEGHALDGLIAGERRGDRELFLRTNSDVPNVGLRTPDAKTIVLRDEETRKRVGVEHFDLVRDPGELAPIADPGEAEEARLVRVMEWAYRKWEEQRAARGEPVQELSDAAKELLESLGYVDGD